MNVITVTGISNREFLDRYARAGRIGLAGGTTFVDHAIRRAERHVHPDGKWGVWSHAFFFEGERVDGHHWVIESDLQIARKHIRLGVQENRVSKYYNEDLYSTLAVLDFSLSEAQVTTMVREGLELMAKRARYSFRELVGALIALRHPHLRCSDNLLARDQSFYCSAFVEYLFRKTGLELLPGVDVKNTTPEEIVRSPLPHATYVLRRHATVSKLTKLAIRLRRRVRSRIKPKESEPRR
jgi:hypothetical protein